MATANPVRIVPNRNRPAHRLTCIPGRSQVRQPRGIVTSPLAPTQPSGIDDIGTGTCRCGQRREYNRLHQRDITSLRGKRDTLEDPLNDGTTTSSGTLVWFPALTGWDERRVEAQRGGGETMDNVRFDRWTKTLSTTRSRRG